MTYLIVAQNVYDSHIVPEESDDDADDMDTGMDRAGPTTSEATPPAVDVVATKSTKKKKKRSKEVVADTAEELPPSPPPSSRHALPSILSPNADDDVEATPAVVDVVSLKSTEKKKKKKKRTKEVVVTDTAQEPAPSHAAEPVSPPSGPTHPSISPDDDIDVFDATPAASVDTVATKSTEKKKKKKRRTKEVVTDTAQEPPPSHAEPASPSLHAQPSSSLPANDQVGVVAVALDNALSTGLAPRDDSVPPIPGRSGDYTHGITAPIGDMWLGGTTGGVIAPVGDLWSGQTMGGQSAADRGMWSDQTMDGQSATNEHMWSGLAGFLEGLDNVVPDHSDHFGNTVQNFVPDHSDHLGNTDRHAHSWNAGPLSGQMYHNYPGYSDNYLDYQPTVPMGRQQMAPSMHTPRQDLAQQFNAPSPWPQQQVPLGNPLLNPYRSGMSFQPFNHSADSSATRPPDAKRIASYNTPLSDGLLSIEQDRAVEEAERALKLREREDHEVQMRAEKELALETRKTSAAKARLAKQAMAESSKAQKRGIPLDADEEDVQQSRGKRPRKDLDYFTLNASGDRAERPRR